jgi:plasmid stabilization system protein ParE
MKKFRIEFTDEAKADIVGSYEWGIREWGPGAALKWYRALRSNVRELLTHFPSSQAIAPESAELGIEVRQVIFLRYRLLFEIDGKTVRILHLKGPFIYKELNSGEIEPLEE